MKFEILKFGDSYYVKYLPAYGNPTWLSRKMTLFSGRTSCSTTEFSSEAAALEACKQYKALCDETIRKLTGVLVRQIEL